MVNFFDTLKQSINFQVILGLLAFKVFSTLLDKVIIPLITIYLLDEDIFRKLNIFIDKDTKTLVLIDPIKNKNIKYEIFFGSLFKDIIIFLMIFIIYYLTIKFI